MSFPTDVEYFPLFEVESVSNGTRIAAHSPLFAEWFQGKKFREVKGLGRVWDGIIFLVPRNLTFPLSFHQELGLFLLNGNNPVPNMLWLFHPDLGKGFELVVPEPLSPNDLEDFFLASCETLRNFYLSEIRGLKFSAKLKEKKAEKLVPTAGRLRPNLEWGRTPDDFPEPEPPEPPDAEPLQPEPLRPGEPIIRHIQRAGHE